MEEFKVTKDRILDAASKCSTAAATLKVLFPEAFEKEKYLDLTKLELCGKNIGVSLIADYAQVDGDSLIGVRTCGKYANKAFYLDEMFDWEIEQEEEWFILIPTRKTECE